MDQAKVSAATIGPVPESCKQLQRFLDFPSFYTIYLLQNNFLVHTSTRRVAFVRSRFCFTSIFVVPDLGCQFVVEVDSSDVGFGAMLSQ